MEEQTIQDMLDQLDIQLASGRIDLPTYQALAAKWQAKLAEVRARGGARAATAAPTIMAERVACPECSAPLEDLQATPGDTVRCAYCRATFTLKRAQEQTETVRQELRRWLDQVVVESVGEGTVDAASRRFIFAERLYPVLEREYRRNLEPYQDVQEHPLLFVDVFAPLDGYRPQDHVLRRLPDSVRRVRELSMRVNEPLLDDFAVVPEDRFRLRSLDFGVSSLVYLANVANHLAQPGPEAYASARENLLALGKECAEYLRMEQHEAGTKQYLQAIQTRVEGSARVLSVLASIFQPGADFAPQPYIDELGAAQTLYREARRLAETAGYNPLSLAPLKTGLERDEQVILFLQALLQAYRTATANRNLDFPTFYADVKALLRVTVPAVSAAGDFTAALNIVDLILRSRRGEECLCLVADWGWVDAQVEAGRKKGFLAGGETVARQSRYYHPFWYATIRYSVAKGAILASGVEKTAYGLMDALMGNANPEIVLPEMPLYSPLAQAVGHPVAVDQIPVLPPLVVRPVAERLIAQAARSLPGVRNVLVKMGELVYLPAVVAHYSSKQGERVASYSLSLPVSAIADTLLLRVEPFFERYL